jgi:hypothetical protein
MTFVIGLDLGQAQDYTAVTILDEVYPDGVQLARPGDEFRRMKSDGSSWYASPPISSEPVEPLFHCRHLERLKLGTSYPNVAKHVKHLMQRLANQASLAVDATGVGRPVIDLLRTFDLQPVGITITGGDTVTHEPGLGWRVPKRDLVSSVQVLLQTERLKFAEDMPLVPVLVQELLAFRVKISDAGHDSYGSWREGVHDDLVLALAVAAWWVQRSTRPRYRLLSSEETVSGVESSRFGYRTRRAQL